MSRGISKSHVLGFVGLALLFIFTASTGVRANHPLFSVCTSDSAFSGSYLAAKACDGNNGWSGVDNRWISGVGLGSHWLRVNFTTLSTLTNVTVHWADMSGAETNLRIETWNGVSWASHVAAFDAASGATTNYPLDTPTNALAFRIIQDGSTQTTMQIAEIYAGAIVAIVPPTVSTVAVSSIVCNGAILNGNLTSKGTAAIVAVGFQYGKSPTLAGATNHTVSANGSVGLFNFTATGLDASTFYYFRAWANGTDGYAQGAILYFQTSACPPVTTCTPGISDSQILTVALFLFMVIVLLALDMTSGVIYGMLASIIGLAFGFYIQTLICNLILSSAIVLTFLLLMIRTIGELIDEKRESGPA